MLLSSFAGALGTIDPFAEVIISEVCTLVCASVCLLAYGPIEIEEYPIFIRLIKQTQQGQVVGVTGW